MLSLKEGDKNKKFFYHLENSHCQSNTIVQLAVNREMSTNEAEINEKNYQLLYTEAGVQRLLLDDLAFQLLMMRNLIGWILVLQRKSFMRQL